MVHRVVVHQGGEVNQLHYRGQRRCPRIAPAGGFLGQEQERGPEHLALHLEQMRVDLGDQTEVGLHDPPKLQLHPLQSGPQAALEIVQTDGGCL